MVVLQLEVKEGLGCESKPEPPVKDIRMNLLDPLQIFEENFVKSNVAVWVFLAQVIYQAERVISNLLRKFQSLPQIFARNISRINRSDPLVLFVSKLIGDLQDSSRRIFLISKSRNQERPFLY